KRQPYIAPQPCHAASGEGHSSHVCSYRPKAEPTRLQENEIPSVGRLYRPRGSAILSKSAECSDCRDSSRFSRYARAARSTVSLRETVEFAIFLKVGMARVRMGKIRTGTMARQRARSSALKDPEGEMTCDRHGFYRWP